MYKTVKQLVTEMIDCLYSLNSMHLGAFGTVQNMTQAANV